MSDNYGDDFQQRSKYERGALPRHYLDWEHKPKPYKTYEDSISRISLPKPDFKEVNFWDTIIGRHSSRRFSNESITKRELSKLLFGMCGLTRSSPQIQYRTTPSAGGLYPIETYPVINNVKGLDKGIYHYYIPEHQLELLEKGDFSKKVAEACLGQAMAARSAVNFVWTALIARSKWKYLQRCYRYIYLDCGHVAQNFYLVAEALKLGACTIGAIFDDELNELLKIDGKKETTIYVGVLGRT